MNPSTLLWIYIVLLIAGGLVGFLKAGSKASIIASCAFAIPLILCATGIISLPYVAEGVLVLLLVFFGMRFAKNKKFMPGGMMTVVTLLVLILLLAARRTGA